MNTIELSASLVATLKKYADLLIYIKGSPDPDALASSFALRELCANLGIRSSIVSAGITSLPQNRAFIGELRIPVSFEPLRPAELQFDAYCILDFQSAAVKGISGKIPCAVHIDHHEPIEPEEGLNVDLAIIDDEAGSTSTIMALLFKELRPDFEPALMARIASALILGLQTDTNNYRLAGRLDYDALSYLNAFADHTLVERISAVPLPDKTAALFAQAMKQRVPYKDWLFTGLGYIDENMRDSIAIIADILLDREKADLVAVFGIVLKKRGASLVLDVSLRARNRAIDLDELIKRITPDGGGRAFKGAFQVNLDYFANGADREKLWELASHTTVEALKRQRDSITLIELKGFYKKFKKRLAGMFKG